MFELRFYLLTGEQMNRQTDKQTNELDTKQRINKWEKLIKDSI